MFMTDYINKYFFYIQAKSKKEIELEREKERNKPVKKSKNAIATSNKLYQEAEEVLLINIR